MLLLPLEGGEGMNEEVKKVVDNFKIIANKKWIKSVSKSFGSIGITFEKELNKNPDALYFPDYYGTEIKCVSRYSRYPLFLFTVAFDGPSFPEINRIVEKYGYPDKTYPDKKVLFEKVSCNKKTFVYLTALHRATQSSTALHHVTQLQQWYSQVLQDNTEKIVAVKTIFEQLEVREACEMMVADYTQKALQILATLPQNAATAQLRHLANKLNTRQD